MITRQELSIVGVLASIFSLRMLGLCMLLPIFALEAQHYASANPQLIGLAIGAYGLAQAVLQVPFGLLSDKYGRKPIMLVGLAMILLGSLIAAWASSIYGLIIGRLLQGCGSIGSVVMATMADNVRAEVRTSAMAILGASIGLSFALALVIGPWLNQWVGLTGVFSVIAIFAMLCSLLVFTIPNRVDCKAISKSTTWIAMLRQTFTRQLLSANYGVFALHASLAALFLVLPTFLHDVGIIGAKYWQFYLVAIIIAMLIAWKFIAFSERKKNMEFLQVVAILGLLFAEGLLYTVGSWLGMAGSLILFFSAFCILEASLPALVSKYAAADSRGAALGMYACLQFLGVFVGGTVGGWLHGEFGAAAVLSFCILLVTAWLVLNMSFRSRLSATEISGLHNQS